MNLEKTFSITLFGLGIIVAIALMTMQLPH